MLIRVAEVEDAPTLWRAEVETARTPGRLVSRPHELVLGAFTAKIAELRALGCYVVAIDETGIYGHAFLDPMSLEALAHIYRLSVVVHPGQTGRGMGTALIRHLQRWATARPAVGRIELLVRASNPDALRLYVRLGFSEEGRFKSRVRLADGTLIDDIAMAWFPKDSIPEPQQHRQ